MLLLLGPSAWAASTHRHQLDRLEKVVRTVAPDSEWALCPTALAPVPAETLRAVEAAIDAFRPQTFEEHRFLEEAYRRLVVRQTERLRFLADADPMLLHFVFLLASPTDRWNVARAEFRRIHGFPRGVAAIGAVLERVLALKRHVIGHLEAQYRWLAMASPRSPRLGPLGRRLGDHRVGLPYVEALKRRYDTLR